MRKDVIDNIKNVRVSSKVLLIALELILVVVVLMVIGYFSFNWAFASLVHTRNEVVVPDIMKKNAKMALDILETNNLAIKKAGEEYDPNMPHGHIIRQLPPAGTTVREGKIVRVWFSQGSEEVYMPNVMGIELRDARFSLRRNHLELGDIINAYSLTFDKGIVISQDPSPDTILPKNAVVNLIVSEGTPPDTMIMMPEFRQKNLSEATRWASENEMDLIIKEDKSSMFPNGIIIDQNLSPDTTIKPNYKVQITVSRRRARADEKYQRVHYELSQGRKESQIRVVLVDSMGETELFSEVKQPGTKVDFTIPYTEDGTIRIFVNGILVQEKDLK